MINTSFDAIANPSENSTTVTPLPPAVYLVGAGPGDPELLTVKAARLLSQADVVLVADSLVPPQVLELARPDAEIVRTADKTLEEVVPLMVERVRSHQSVVRLQSGDPSLYSAIYEQMRALAEAQVPFEVIPGISAFQAAAARLKVELTVPDLVQTIILTRIAGRTHVPASEDLALLAAHRASLCLYLSARHVQAAQDKLLQHYNAETPVAICYRLGWADEQVWLVTLQEMASVTQQENLVRTTFYLISPALASIRQRGLLTGGVQQNFQDDVRSRLYHADYERLFRPKN